ncbi:unnamed protein product [Gongylonema pulchrum]|uniref:Uncharacterized protein n=1 Tax=Gongylonema pulchrum TaxID=637853 RepID=A0A183EQ21_9BILA|nr:unnamed protein product [Gongylonema pulchrum]
MTIKTTTFPKTADAKNSSSVTDSGTERREPKSQPSWAATTKIPVTSSGTSDAFVTVYNKSVEVRIAKPRAPAVTPKGSKFDFVGGNGSIENRSVIENTEVPARVDSRELSTVRFSSADSVNLAREGAAEMILTMAGSEVMTDPNMTTGSATASTIQSKENAAASEEAAVDNKIANAEWNLGDLTDRFVVKPGATRASQPTVVIPPLEVHCSSRIKVGTFVTMLAVSN